MDTNLQTSFIPKKVIVEETVKEKKPMGLVVFIATAIFFVAIVSAGGVYFYKAYIAKNVADMQVSLDRAKGAFEPKTINALQVLDKRINSSFEILNNHISVYPVFKALEGYTLKTTQFTKFEYKFTKDKTTKIIVSMSGTTKSYDLLALQAESLGKNENIKDPIFSNLNLDGKGNVTFDLTFSVDPLAVLYQKNLDIAN